MRRIAAVVVGAALLALPACGGKTDETTRAAGITPATAVAFLSVNLDPSIEQKRNLLSLARRFPDAPDEVRGEFEDARDGLLAEMLADTGLDFERDVKPWLGNEVAVAVLPGPADGDEPLFVALVESDDDDKAKAALDKAARDEGFEGSYRIIDDFAVISAAEDDEGEKAALDQIAAQAGKDDGGLAEAEAFTDVVDELAGDRLVLGWMNFKRLEELMGGAAGAGGLIEPFTRAAANADGVAFDLHVEKAAIVLQGVAAAKAEGNGEQPELTRSLPAATLAALTLFNVRAGAAQALEGLAQFAGDFLYGFEDQTGLDLEDDLLSWMGGEMVVAVGPVREGGSFPDLALVVEPTDKARAEQAIGKIRAALSDQGFELDEREVGGTPAYVVPQPMFEGVQPAMGLFEDRFILATSPQYVEELVDASGAKLADTDAYVNVLADGSGENTTMQLVVLIDPIREAIERFVLTDPGDRADYEAEVKPNLEPLSAFGIVARQDGDFGKVTVKLSFDD